MVRPEKAAKIAAALLCRCPPRHSAENLDLVTALVSPSWDFDSDRTTVFLDEVATKVDQQLALQVCPSTTTTTTTTSSSQHPPPAAPHQFVACEYNRIGSDYRCPVCDVAVPTDGSNPTTIASSSLSATLLSDPLSFTRQLEVGLNDVMSEYVSQYYGKEGAVCSVLVWRDGEEVEEGADPLVPPLSMGVAVCIVKQSKSQRGEAEEAGGAGVGGGGCSWCSFHVIAVTIPPPAEHEDDDETKKKSSSVLYAYHTTIGLDAATKGKSSVRFNGFTVSDAAKQCHGRATRPSASSSSSYRSLMRDIIVDVGEKIEEIENSLRDGLEALHFGRGAEVLLGLRRGGGSAAAVGSGGGSSVSSSRGKSTKLLLIPESEEGTVANSSSPQQEPNHQREEEGSPSAKGKSKKKKAASSLWEPCQDEEGNTYYYHTVTGEVSWELPSDAVPTVDNHLAEEAAPSSPQPVEESVGEVAAATSSRPAVADALRELTLSSDVEEYIAGMKSYVKDYLGFKKLTWESLQGLVDATYDDEEGNPQSALEYVVPVYGDRRKILKLVQKMMSTSE